jgi:hypothetical protein
MSLENKVDITVYREMLGQELTDEEWVAFASYVESSVEEFLEERLGTWLQFLPEIVKEERKYE